MQTPRADHRLAHRHDRAPLARAGGRTARRPRSPRPPRANLVVAGTPRAVALCAALTAVLLAACTSTGEDRVARPALTTQPGRDAAQDGSVQAGAAAAPPTRATPTPAGAVAVGADGAPYCGPSQDVEEIVVQRWTDTRFRISLRPTPASRRASRTLAVAAMWSAIGACVRGLSGPVADSLHAQLTCHQALAQIPALGGGAGFATGDTYDLESWRPLMRPNQFSTWVSTRCANTLGTDPSGPAVRVYRPDGVAVAHTISGEHD
ncbi:DUF2599 domain-containing protein [Frankia sp. AgB32]|uniref:DUF2599 domain-containing protein n=1 Tax=Frankia sp. AgB32 TaxID=631119 RepID=UPI00200EF833|nr:DUF2599 domain-containing protein [Frankia sp. AgB32]MCK9897721.1 DUF2599 domain-containing protein [Frankia sp. AgB32]